MDLDNLRDLTAMAPRAASARIALFRDFEPGGEGRPVPDPYYGKAADFERVVDLAEAAARGLLAALRSGRGLVLRDRG